jgi:hypothetical protein
MNEAAKIAGVASIIFLILAEPGRTQEQDRWNEYRNERFGFLLLYPPELVPGPAEMNNAGRTFSAADGSFCVLAHAFDSDERGENATWEEFCDILYDNSPRSSDDYRTKGDKWYLISGYREDTEYYFKIYYRGEDRNPVEFMIFYPHAMADRFKPWVDRIANTFVSSIPGVYQ